MIQNLENKTYICIQSVYICIWTELCYAYIIFEQLYTRHVGETKKNPFIRPIFG